MSAHRYNVGDRIVLNEGPVRLAGDNGSCRVVGLLPTSFNEPQYRVRYEGENFDRRVSESDVDVQKSSRTGPTEGEDGMPASGAWVTSLATTTKR